MHIAPDLWVPASALTLRGFIRWAHSPRFPQQEKLTYVGGEVHIDMSPEELRTHNPVKRDVIVDMTLHVRAPDLGRVYVDGALLVNEAADLACEPDVVFCSWDTLESGRVKLVERDIGSGRIVELHGSPDLVVEIVSRSSVKRDTVDLPAAYHRGGIPEYWIIDARGEAIVFRVLQWQPDGYCDQPSDATGKVASLVFGTPVSLSRQLDRAGEWRYTLHIG